MNRSGVHLSAALSPSTTGDVYAKGMSAWSAEDEERLLPYRRWQINLIRPFLGKRILEVGAGNGQMASLIVGEGLCERYLALEPSEHFFSGLAQLAKDDQVLEVRKGSIESINVAGTDLFDSIVTVHVLEHIEADGDFLSSCYERLRPGGYLITLVPALDFLYSPLDRKVGHFRRYDVNKMRRHAAQLGARVVINRYDNFLGVFGWLLACKWRRLDYHTEKNKKQLFGFFQVFLKYVLPLASKVEAIIAPPIGLNLTAVFQKPLEAEGKSR